MTTDIVLRSTDVPASFSEQMTMAKVLAVSTLLPGHLRHQPANVLVVLGGARALDVPAFWAFQSMHVVDGKLGMAAELMRALVIRAGHRFRVVERSRQRAVVEIRRKDRETPYRAEFSWEDAKTAELTGKDNWRKYPQAMMVARATAIAARDECSDVLFGIIYTPDELGAVTDEEGAPVDPAKVVDGEVVEPPTPEELAEWGSQIASVPLELLPQVWAEAVARGAAGARLGETEDTLQDSMATRLGLESLDCADVQEIRNIWNLAKLVGVLDRPVRVGGEVVPLREYLAKVADDTTRQEDPTDTENAREMREAAAASWDGTVVEGEVVVDEPGASPY